MIGKTNAVAGGGSDGEKEIQAIVEVDALKTSLTLTFNAKVNSSNAVYAMGVMTDTNYVETGGNKLYGVSSNFAVPDLKKCTWVKYKRYSFGTGEGSSNSTHARLLRSPALAKAIQEWIPDIFEFKVNGKLPTDFSAKLSAALYGVKKGTTSKILISFTFILSADENGDLVYTVNNDPTYSGVRIESGSTYEFDIQGIGLSFSSH